MARSALNTVQEDVVGQVLADDPEATLGTTDQLAPAYELVGEASIPVSKKAGRRWEERIKDALSASTDERSYWDEAYASYRQVGARTNADNPSSPGKITTQNDTDENLTRENVKMLLRTTYTRNPKIELSSTDEERKPLARTLTLVLSALMNRKSTPGLNAKARIRRAIVHAHLTNFGVLKVGFQPKLGSRQEALQQLYDLQKKLSTEKDPDKLEALYAELEQNEDNLPLYTDMGVKLNVTLPHRLIIDPHCTTADLTDADWVTEEFWSPTAFIKNRYLEKNEDEAWVRKNNKRPVTVLDASKPGKDSADAVRQSVLDQVDGYTSDERAGILAKDHTRCYMIWDRLTRQISLYLADDMSYPLWVTADDLKLSRFYQHHLIQYTEPLDGVVQPGEAAQYMGQVREINKINKRVGFIRMLAFGQLVYNTKVLKPEAVNKLIAHMKNPEEFDAIGVEWDVETKLSDVFDVFVPPDAKIQELYNKGELMKVVDRINAVSSLARGEQLKTNTTNKAVEAYTAQTATVANELTDVVEDALEELAWSLCEIIVSKMSAEQVASLIGAEEAKNFQSLSVEEFNAKFGLTVAAGSTEKPTSENKRKEAIAIAQALGQFGQAAPITTLTIVTRLFSEAFSEFQFTTKDAEMLKQEATQNVGAAQAQGTPGAPGAPPPTPPGGPGGGPPATGVVAP